MTVRFPSLLIAAALALGAAVAPAAADPRIERVRYDADRVVTLRGQSNVQTMIEFAPDERIENIAVGDSAAWQVTPNKRGNLLFLKPQGARARTNMTVVTDQRRYLFELVGVGPGVRPVYVLRFTYPEPLLLLPATPSAPGSGESATGPSATSATATPPAQPSPPPAPPRNTAWRVTGDRALLPEAVSDDGQATYLQWSAARDLPAILAVGADGQEGPVNFTVREGTIVIDGVAPRYVLRIGKASAVLERAR
jgi:type IV secretion system protein VirB9